MQLHRRPADEGIMRAGEGPGITLCWPRGKIAPVERFERTRRDWSGDTAMVPPPHRLPSNGSTGAVRPSGRIGALKGGGTDRASGASGVHSAPPPDRGRPGGGIPLVSNPALRHDFGNPLRIPGVQIPPTFKDLQDVFLIGQPDQPFERSSHGLLGLKGSTGAFHPLRGPPAKRAGRGVLQYRTARRRPSSSPSRHSAIGLMAFSALKSSTGAFHPLCGTAAKPKAGCGCLHHQAADAVGEER